MQNWPMRGTILNTIAVIIGALVGLATGSLLPTRIQDTVIVGFGLVTVGLGVMMFLKSKNPLIVIGSIALGGIIGTWIGIDVGLEQFSEWVRQSVGGGATFNEGLITTSVLFCVGPMTLLGCLQDAIEKKIEILSLKSLLDGISAIFFASSLGLGVLFSAGVVLVIQGTLTLLARPLRKFAENQESLAEATAIGGIMLMAIGLNLANVAELHAENFAPALLLAPFAPPIINKFTKNKAKSNSVES